MIYIILILIALLLASIYANFNILKKYEKAEEINNEFAAVIDELNTSVNNMYQELKLIDKRGSFEADDEVGYFFKSLKEIIEELKDFLTSIQNKESSS